MVFLKINKFVMTIIVTTNYFMLKLVVIGFNHDEFKSQNIKL